jgi:DNA-binding IclR family transcriptional regulator
MSTANRLLAVLGLFTLERPKWTVDAAAFELGMTVSTAYRYFKSLVDAGLVAADTPRHYTLGPAIIEYDRQMRLRDPLIETAAPVMQELTHAIGSGAVILLCRIYRRRVVCVHQETLETDNFYRRFDGSEPISYERGQPMPLHRGAPSKAILAYMKGRQVRALYDADSEEWRAAGLGDNWPEVKRTLRIMRNRGMVVTYGEMTVGMQGIAVPVLAGQTGVIGSLSAVVAPDRLTNPVDDIGRTLAEGARRIGAQLVQKLESVAT